MSPRVTGAIRAFAGQMQHESVSSGEMVGAKAGVVGDGVVRGAIMRRLYGVVEKVARGTISVLVLGETGVGKDVVATAVHERSARRDFPFVRLNCATLSESLLESELFGYQAGAFTGARSAKAVGTLRKAGFNDVWNVARGINGWSEDIDPSVPKY